MHLQIITPEKVIFDYDVESVTAPGKDGEFQLLKNHAPIVSTLDNGEIKIKITKDTFIDFDNLTGELKRSTSNQLELFYQVKGGVLEMSNNNIIVLAN